MKIKDKICTLEQAMKFDELGFKIDSDKLWVPTGLTSGPQWCLVDHSYTVIENRFYPAPDVSELMDILPKETKVEITQHSHKGVSICIGIGSGYWHSMGVSLIDALTKLVIILIRNNHVNPELLNIGD